MMSKKTSSSLIKSTRQYTLNRNVIKYGFYEWSKESGKYVFTPIASNPLSSLDRHTQHSIELIHHLLFSSNSSGLLAIVGLEKSGKSFLINNYAANLDKWPQTSSSRIIRINSNSNYLTDTMKTAEKFLNTNNLTPEELIWVSTDRKIAEAFVENYPESKHILEINYDEIISIKDDDFFAQCQVLSLSSNIYTLKDLSIALKANSNSEIAKELIDEFFLKDLALKFTADANAHAINPGLWNTNIINPIMDLFESEYFDESELDNIITKDKLKALFFDKHDKDEEKLQAWFGKTKAVLRKTELAEKLIGSSSANLSWGDMFTLQQRLSMEIFGQEEAISTVVEDLFVPAANLQYPGRPLRSFVFLGPSGVGKTKLAQVLSNELMSSPINLIRIDMSEYSNSHDAAKFIGSPPGYVGHSQGGQLTAAIKKNPNSIVLLDEIEKADHSVWDTFLQVLDAGRLTDSKGEEVDFTQAIIIMTSNLGVKEAVQNRLGFGAPSENEAFSARKAMLKSSSKRALEEFFKPEFLNRIDEIIVFSELNRDVLIDIIQHELNKISEIVKNNGNFNMEECSEDILNFILEKVDASRYGAREIQRVIHKEIRKLIARQMLLMPTSKNISLMLKDNSIQIEAN